MSFSLDVKEEGPREGERWKNTGIKPEKAKAAFTPPSKDPASSPLLQASSAGGRGILPCSPAPPAFRPHWADSPASPLCALGTFLTPGPIPGSPRDQRASLSLDRLSNSSKRAFSSPCSPPFTHFLSYSSSSWFLVISQRNRVPSCEPFTL